MMGKNFHVAWPALALLLWGCQGCGEGNGAPEVRIAQIEIMSMDPNYAEDPWGEEGNPDLYADLSVNESPYFTSPVAQESSLPQRIDLGGVVIQGAELDQTVTLRVFDEDDDSLDDFVGEVSFVPRDLLFSEPVRHSLYGGYLQVDLLLSW